MEKTSWIAKTIYQHSNSVGICCIMEVCMQTEFFHISQSNIHLLVIAYRVEMGEGGHGCLIFIGQ